MKKYDFCKDWTLTRGRTPDQSETVRLPHDAMITDRRGPKAQTGPSGAYFYGDVYTYEKVLSVPSEWKNNTVTLEFEGAYRKTTVYVNGEKAVFHPYGYTPFFVVLDDYLKYGEDNTIKVVCDNEKMPCSRWYSGGGLYRPVNLYVQPKDHIAMEGVFVSTESYDPAVIRVQTEVVGAGDVRVSIRKDGKEVAAADGADVTISVPDAKLWSAETPELYDAVVTLTNGKSTDEVSVTFGIKKVR